MKVNIDPEWHSLLSAEFEKPYFHKLVDFVKREYSTHTCYPPGPEIFNAFEHCAPSKLKVVIIGQDPYHGPGQANGLCFSVSDGVKFPPSLRNIFKEIHDDLGKEAPTSGNLERWADQGVLLLNSTLTVRERQPGSHQNQGWEEFTDSVIKLISENLDGVVFLLWGAFAQGKKSLIDAAKHHVLLSPHPSPFSAHKGFFGNGHFSKANALLASMGKSEINW
ncbi:MAG: uracil-DNA glycosylase [Flavobacteriales bacterium]|nr:uracil-DNA glycosylase [Flavobacteriales bacterium]